jgi:hypothetical protein
MGGASGVFDPYTPLLNVERRLFLFLVKKKKKKGKVPCFSLLLSGPIIENADVQGSAAQFFFWRGRAHPNWVWGMSEVRLAG